MAKLRYIFLILAVLTIITGFSKVWNQDRHLNLRKIPRKLELTQGHMNQIAGYLRDYKKKTGRYPSNDESLLVLKDLVNTCSESGYGSTGDLLFLRVRDSGILTVWGDPFIYENRQGLPKSAFLNSGADNDRSGNYSVRVDEDIYVWSLAAEQNYRLYGMWIPRLNKAKHDIVIVTIFLACLFAHGTWLSAKSKHSGYKRFVHFAVSSILGLILSLAFLVISLPCLVATCYEASAMEPRTPKLTHDYITLITKYHDRGVISEKAYEKIIKNIKSSPL